MASCLLLGLRKGGRPRDGSSYVATWPQALPSLSRPGLTATSTQEAPACPLEKGPPRQLQHVSASSMLHGHLTWLLTHPAVIPHPAAPSHPGCSLPLRLLPFTQVTPSLPVCSLSPGCSLSPRLLSPTQTAPSNPGCFLPPRLLPLTQMAKDGKGLEREGNVCGHMAA